VGDGGVDDSPQGEDAVGRSDRIAVLPDRVGAQVDRARPPVGRDLQFLREPRPDRELRVEIDEIAGDVLEHELLRHVGLEHGVQGGGLAEESAIENGRPG
jgi:hypothetical protein